MKGLLFNARKGEIYLTDCMDQYAVYLGKAESEGYNGYVFELHNGDRFITDMDGRWYTVYENQNNPRYNVLSLVT